MSFSKASFRQATLAYYGSQIGPRPAVIPEVAPKKRGPVWLYIALPCTGAVIAAITVAIAKPWVYRGQDLSYQREEYVQAYGTSAQYFKNVDNSISTVPLKKTYVPGSATSKGLVTNAFILSFFQSLYADYSFPVTDVPVIFTVDCPVHDWTLYSRMEVLSSIDTNQGVLTASVLSLSSADPQYLSDGDLVSRGQFQHFEIDYDPANYAIRDYSMSLLPNQTEIAISEITLWDFEHSLNGKPYLFSPSKDSDGKYTAEDEAEFTRLKQEAYSHRYAFAQMKESVRKASGDYRSIYQAKVKEFSIFD